MQEDEEIKPSQSLVLSVNRVKNIIKNDVEVKSISTEACFAIAKATELLLDDLALRSSRFMVNNTRESLDYEDVAEAVAEHTGYDFLDEIVPQTIPAAVVLARMKKQPPKEPSKQQEKEQQQQQEEQDKVQP